MDAKDLKIQEQAKEIAMLRKQIKELKQSYGSLVGKNIYLDGAKIVKIESTRRPK